jgi:hypothetical protein
MKANVYLVMARKQLQCCNLIYCRETQSYSSSFSYITASLIVAMPGKRKRKNPDHSNEIEDFAFIDIPTTNSEPSTSTVSVSQVINVTEWNIDGNRISTSNTLTTSVSGKALATTPFNASCVEPQFDLANAYLDMSGTDPCADAPQPTSTEKSRNVVGKPAFLAIPALISSTG